jgi:hypothetical protein
MSTALEKLDNIIVDLEKQSNEIEKSGNVLQKISNVELQIKKTTELTKEATENLSGTLANYTGFIDTLDIKIKSQNSILNNLKSDTKKQISEFSHEFIEKVSVLRDESLNAHIDLRQDIERVNKSNAQLNESIKQISSELSSYIIKNSKEQKTNHDKLKSLLAEQNKKIAINNKIVIYIASLTTVLLPLSIYLIK